MNPRHIPFAQTVTFVVLVWGLHLQGSHRLAAAMATMGLVALLIVYVFADRYVRRLELLVKQQHEALRESNDMLGEVAESIDNERARAFVARHTKRGAA